jgi:hypothetical protein
MRNLPNYYQTSINRPVQIVPINRTTKIIHTQPTQLSQVTKQQFQNQLHNQLNFIQKQPEFKGRRLVSNE